MLYVACLFSLPAIMEERAWMVSTDTHVIVQADFPALTVELVSTLVVLAYFKFLVCNKKTKNKLNFPETIPLLCTLSAFMFYFLLWIAFPHLVFNNE